MRKDKPCTGDKFGSESCPPGSKRYNLAKTFRKMAKEGVNEGKLGHLERASVLAASDDPKDQDKAREIKTRFDYESLKRQIGSKKKPSKPAVKEAAGAGVPLTPQELEIQKKMSRLNVRLAKKRSQQLQKAKLKDTEDSPEKVKDDQMQEGSLHKWFKGSKSKDGKAGWVNVKTGGTCASDEPGEGTPKCVSSAKRASMTKAERDSASRRKKAADPNQQQKSGAAKPTYVRTDAKKKMKESKDVMDVAKELTKASKMHKGQAEKLKKHAKDMKETKNCGCGQDPCITYGKKEEVDEACWKGYRAKGMKKKGGKLVPNCKPIGEAKVDKGRSDYGKASIRNYRRSGPGHGEPAMFDPENKRGKLIDKRREEHKARRGVKGAKVPAYKVSESKDKAFDYVVAKLRKQHGKDAVITKTSKPKPPSAAQKAKAAAERKKRQDADNKAYAARAKKAGFKSTQDYTDVVARYGSEDNYRKGKGLGT